MLIYGPTVLLVLLAALLVDRLLGEPDIVWSRIRHPVAWLGTFVGAADRHLNRPDASSRENRLRGTIALALIVLVTLAAGTVLAALARLAPIAVLIEVVIVAALLAHKSLVDHVDAVRQALGSGLVEARRVVGHIVGRDTTTLDESGVARAAIESCAENVSDGVVAPALAYGLFGLPGLFFYKAVNTADSMIGHRDARYRSFGWASARADDLLNILPARLTALLYALLAGRQMLAVWRSVRADAPAHRSPNAGWPEAALAAHLGLALGGPRRYGETQVEGVWLNERGRADAGPDDIRRAIEATDRAWLLLALTVLALYAGTV